MLILLFAVASLLGVNGKVNHKRVKNITLGFVSLVPQQPGVVDPSMEMALGNMEKRMKSAAALGNAYQSGFQNWQPLEFTEKWKNRELTGSLMFSQWYRPSMYLCICFPWNMLTSVNWFCLPVHLSCRRSLNCWMFPDCMAIHNSNWANQITRQQHVVSRI